MAAPPLVEDVYTIRSRHLANRFFKKVARNEATETIPLPDPISIGIEPDAYFARRPEGPTQRHDYLNELPKQREEATVGIIGAGERYFPTSCFFHSLVWLSTRNMTLTL
jgi:hypothetical protein